MDTSKSPPSAALSSDHQSSTVAGSRDLILLSSRDLDALLTPKDAIDGLQQAYRQLAAHRADGGKSIGFVVEGGSIHVKAGLLPGLRSAFAAKVNINLPNNWQTHRLPTIQGLLVLMDGVAGRPLALMESMTLTAIRTAATATLAARYGARPDARRVAMIGCGAQAPYQLEALRTCFAVEQIRLFDIDAARARALAATIADAGLHATAAPSVSAAVDGADICITCTTSKQPVLTGDMPLEGCFVAAVGADNPDKCEIDAALMARARILVDDLEQCAVGGDLAHALRAGVVTRDRVHADLADLAAGRRSGRANPDEVVIFDSTGSGVQDVATAWAAYRAAHASGAGTRFDLKG